VTVTKVVGFDLRIPKHFSLHFYDFSTILYGIYKFAVFENKRKRKRTFASRPLELRFLLTRGPWTGFRTEEGRRGWGPAGEEQEDVGAHLLAVLGWAGTACGGGAAEGGGGGGSVPRRRLAGGAGMGRPGLGASVGGEEGGCGLELG